MLKILALHCILCLLAIWIAEAEDKDAEFDRITNNFRSFLENTTDEQMKGTAEQIDFEALGVPGINYNMNGTRPYIICDYLNVSECDPKLNPNCPTQRECYGFKDHPVLSCLTVFQYHPTLKEAGTKSKHLPVPDSSVVMMGCMGFKKDSAHFCDNKCDAVSAEPSGTRREGDPASSPPGPGYGWCCCHSHNCNGYGKVKAQNPFFPTPKDMKTSEPEPSFAKYGWVAGIVAFAIIMCFGICYLAFKMYTWFKKPQQGFQMVDAELALEPLVADDHPNPPANHEVDGAVAVEAEAVSNEPPVPEFPEENVFNVCLDSQVMVSRGRYGSVWRARREVDGKLTYVAVKKHTENAFASYNAEKKIFDTLSEIPWYRSIVGYVGSHQMGQEYWIITEFQERLSLLSLIQNHVISLQAALRIILSMLDGLQFLHDERPFYYGDQKQAIIHRDIKSQNILIRSDMTACICDFGLAILVDEAVMRKRIEMLGQVGTRRYMAPEVLEGATEFTPAAFKQMDVYSMALVIWETLGRTKATEEDVVPEYMLPYEDHVGARPTLGEMREVACTKKLRPEFRPALFDNVKTEILVSTVRDMWDSLSDARLTAGCAFRRILKIAIEPLDISEGYYSEGRCEEDIMMDYHRLFTKHPTADPFLFEPKPPPVPLLGDDEPPEEPQVEEEPPRGNVVYDLDRQMLVHPDELVLRPRRSVDSTPTPTEMSSDDEFD